MNNYLTNIDRALFKKHVCSDMRREILSFVQVPIPIPDFVEFIRNHINLRNSSLITTSETSFIILYLIEPGSYGLCFLNKLYILC